jgi:ABC-type glycerol-3-phosphate transport system substrate-binding protein
VERVIGVRIGRRELLLAAGAGAVATGGGYLLLRDRDGSPEPGTLRIMSGRDESIGGLRHQLLQEWAAANPANPSEILEVGGVADAHRSEMVASAQSGEYSVDIFNLDVTWIAEFAEAGYIRPLPSDVDTTGFLEQALEACRYDGELWALPFNTDAGLLYFPTSLVPVPPADWGGLEALVGDVFNSEAPPRGLLAGYAGQFANYEGLTVNALEMIWASHGELVSGDWREPVIEPDTSEVREGLARLARVNVSEEPQLILRDSVTFDETATTTAFSERRVLFMRNWPIAYRNLQRAADGGASPDAGWFGVRPLPGPSVLGGQNLAIARHSPRPHAAQALIEFLTSEPSQRHLFGDGGLAATRHAVYDDRDIMEKRPYAPHLRDAIASARLRPVTPYYARFSETFREGMRHAMANDGALPDGPDAFAERLAGALRGFRR